jgi:hypothetical protein
MSWYRIAVPASPPLPMPLHPTQATSEIADVRAFDPGYCPAAIDDPRTGFKVLRNRFRIVPCRAAPVKRMRHVGGRKLATAATSREQREGSAAASRVLP